MKVQLSPNDAAAAANVSAPAESGADTVLVETGISSQGPTPEIGGRRDGTDPTRFGDWEKGGRCVDF
jgi:hypothetical protein